MKVNLIQFINTMQATLLILTIVMSFFAFGEGCYDDTIDYLRSINFYITQNPGCTDFTFNSCKITYDCDEYGCSYQFWSEDWNFCLSYKCDLQDRAKTYENLDQCYKNQMRKRLILGLSLGLGIPFTICIFTVCWDRYTRRLQASRNADSVRVANSNPIERNQNASNYNYSIKRLENAEPLNSQKQLTVKIKQKEKQNQEQIDRLQQCSICLDFNPGTFLSCGHVFHLQCIDYWTLRSQNCPNCRKKIEKAV